MGQREVLTVHAFFRPVMFYLVLGIKFNGTLNCRTGGMTRIDACRVYSIFRNMFEHEQNTLHFLAS